VKEWFWCAPGIYPDQTRTRTFLEGKDGGKRSPSQVLYTPQKSVLSTSLKFLVLLKSISMHYCLYLILKAIDIVWIYTLQIFIPTVVHNTCILITEQINSLFCSTDVLTNF